MFAYVKLVAPATAGGWALLASAVPAAGTVLALVGIATIVGGALAVGALRAQLANAKGGLALARDELDVHRTRSQRLEQELAIEKARPNLEQHAKLLEGLTELVIEQGNVLRAVWTATVPPDSRDPADIR